MEQITATIIADDETRFENVELHLEIIPAGRIERWSGWLSLPAESLFMARQFTIILPDGRSVKANLHGTSEVDLMDSTAELIIHFYGDNTPVSS